MGVLFRELQSISRGNVALVPSLGAAPPEAWKAIVWASPAQRQFQIGNRPPWRTVRSGCELQWRGRQSCRRCSGPAQMPGRCTGGRALQLRLSLWHAPGAWPRLACTPCWLQPAHRPASLAWRPRCAVPSSHGSAASNRAEPAGLGRAFRCPLMTQNCLWWQWPSLLRIMHFHW